MRLTRDRNGEVKVNSKQIKLGSATIGASALIAMGAFARRVDQHERCSDGTCRRQGPITTSEITTGETITETVAPEAPETTAAIPPITQSRQP